MRYAAVLLALLYCDVHAAENWFGYGDNLSCGTFISNRRTPNVAYDNYVGTWFLGFVTAYNYYGSTTQVKVSLPQDTTLAWFDKYCRDSPLATVGSGALELIKVYAK